MKRKFLNRDRSSNGSADVRSICVERKPGQPRLIVYLLRQSFDSIEFNPALRAFFFPFFLFFTRTARSKFIIYPHKLLAAPVFSLRRSSHHAIRRRRRRRTARRNIALRKGYVYFATVFLFARVPARNSDR